MGAMLNGLMAASLLFGSAALAQEQQEYFSCKTSSGKLVRFSGQHGLLHYSYGRPGRAPDLAFKVPLNGAEFTGVGPASIGTWWITREITVKFNGTAYTGFWAFHRGDHREEAGIRVTRGEQVLAETPCRSEIVLNLPEIEE